MASELTFLPLLWYLFLMSRPPGYLTLRQRRLVEALPTSQSATEAARKAGYSPTSAAESASQSLRLSNVKAALVEIGMDASKFAAVLSLAKRKERLSKLAEPEPEHPDPMRAIDLLNRMDNLYVTRVDQRSIGHLVVHIVPFGGEALIDADVVKDADDAAK